MSPADYPTEIMVRVMSANDFCLSGFENILTVSVSTTTNAEQKMTSQLNATIEEVMNACRQG